MTDPGPGDDLPAERERTPRVSPGALAVFLALPASALLLLTLVLGPGILLALGALALLVAVPIVASRLLGPRDGAGA